MRTPAIILIAVLFVIAGGLHFAFFGPMAKDWKDCSQKLIQSRGEYMTIAVFADDPTKIISIARGVQDENKILRAKLDEIGGTYRIAKSTLDEEGPEQTVLNRLRKLEQTETSTARLTGPTQPTTDGETRVTVLKNWGIGSELVEGENKNRFFRATQGNSRTYAGGPTRISCASGTIDMMVRPFGWNGADDRQDRMLLFANGTLPGAGEKALPRISTIEILKSSRGRLEFALTNPVNQPLVRSADVSNWKDGEWHRVTIAWSKSPQETDLFIDGKRSSALEVTSRASFATRPSTRTRLAPIEYDMMYEMYGMGAMPGMMPPYGPGAWPGTRRPLSLPSTARGPLAVENVPLPEAVDRLLVGAGENKSAPAEMDVDNLVILRRAVAESELSSPMQYTEDTLLFDDFQTPFGDIRLLDSTLYEMQGCIKLIRDSATQQELRDKKEQEYQLLKRSIGLDEEKIRNQPPKTAYLVKVLTADQIQRLVKDKYSLDELKKTLRVERLTPGNKDQLYQLESITGFLDLTLELVDKARNDRLAELSEVVILGESHVVSDKDLMDQFKKHLEALGEKLGIGKMPAGMPGMMGPGMMGPGMPYMSPEFAPEMAEMYAYGGYGAYMGFPGMGMNLPAGMDFAQWQEEMSRYQRFDTALKEGVIPPEVRAELDRAEQKEGFYTRRLLQLDVLGKIDYLPQFLYDLEFKDHLASIQAIGMQRETEELIKCTVALDVHYLSPGQTEPEGPTVAAAPAPPR